MKVPHYGDMVSQVAEVMARGRLARVFALCLLGNTLCVPLDGRMKRGYDDNKLDSFERAVSPVTLPTEEPSVAPINPAVTLPPVASNYLEKKRESQTPGPFDDDDDDDFEPMQTSPSVGGGSNIFSLLNLANGLLPGFSGATGIMRTMIRELIRQQISGGLGVGTYPYLLRRHDVKGNEIDVDFPYDLKPPPLQRQEDDDDDSRSDSRSENRSESRTESRSESRSESSSDSEEDNAGEESVEENNNNASQQNSGSKADENRDDDDNGDANDSDFDDEPPGGGDGQGGGILGLLAGLSGGENGESDLGSLLATVSGIVVNLSGDGFDLNSLIASALGLFVGLLSEGEENPGEIIASYLLTSLDTITGGGAQNNGAFFGKLLSKLISGTSMGEAPEGSSDESGEAEGMKDSAGFLLSLLMGLSGEMSKSSSTGSSQPS